MGFSQYLDENSAIEWKRGYIDYQACARQIRIISARINGKAVEDVASLSNGEDNDHGPVRKQKKPLPPKRDQPGLRRRRTAGVSSAPRLSLPPSLLSLSWMPAGTTALDRSTGPSTTSVDSGVPASPRRGIRKASVASASSDEALPLPQSRRKSTSRLNLSAKAASGLEEIRDDDEERQDEEDRGSFTSPGSIRRHTTPRAPGTPREEADRFSPNRSDAPPPAETPPHLACILPPSEARKARLRSPISPTRGLGLQLSSLSAKDLVRRLPATPAPPPAPPPPESPRADESVTEQRPSTASNDSKPSQPSDLCSAKSLEELFDYLEPDEYAFFQLLDKELKKVESFFNQRQANCQLKHEQLEQQLGALQARGQRRHRGDGGERRFSHWENRMDTLVAATARMLGMEHTPGQHNVGEHGGGTTQTSQSGAPNEKDTNHAPDSTTAGHHIMDDLEDEEEELFHINSSKKSQRNLQQEMNEFYHHLEILKNFRIINLTGFRKALRKFESTTKIACLDLYTEERIDPSCLSHGEILEELLARTEQLYAKHFTNGDIQAARRELRLGIRVDTFYEVTYRGAFMCGLGLLAAVMAIVKYFDPDLRRNVPAYDALLVIYSALYLPVIFALLFQFNLDGWVRMRINYEYVMEITRPCLDHRCFHEIPAFMFMTLSYCFFFSFYQIAPHSVAPTTWPSAWLVFIAAFFLNPLPICRMPTRWWFLRAMARVITPGLSSVKFVVFFIADILNSFTYTIQNIYFLGCIASKRWPSDYIHACRSSDWAFVVLGSLAPLVRLIQCLKRYWDTRVPIHLVNAVKYSISIITTSMVVWNRARGFMKDTRSLVLWIIFASTNSLFGLAWDFVVDWSLLRPGYKLLRPDLAYPSRWLYYFAMALNILVRFSWVWTLPEPSQVPGLRSWIFAVLEIVRRWVWNFFRVETEHLGNADAYRVTGEVPIPARNLVGSAAPRTAHHGPVRRNLSKLGDKLVGSEAGRGPDALNIGARGRAGQREYEARRPGDYGNDLDMNVGNHIMV